MEELCNNHKYAPLRTEFSEIRVLNLLPDSDPDGRVRGKLQHVNLDNRCPPYRALSYTWGETSVMTAQTIEIDGNSNFLVTPNACQALKDIRPEAQPLLIWIDAICIDQENVIERNRQVRLMSKIYKKASEVLTWLDCEISDQSGFFETLESFDFDEIMYDGVEPEELGDPDTSLRVLQKIIPMPYWTRVWVQQEVRVTSDYLHLIYFRRRKLESWRLQVFLRFSARKKRVKEEDIDSLSELLRGSGHSEIPGRMYSDILQALAWSSLLEATDQRDHVYGILGAVDDPRISELTVDYAATVSEVFIQAAVYIVKRHRSVDFLPCASGSSTALCMPDSPTWVPRWCDNHEYLRHKYWFEGGIIGSTSEQWPAVSSCGKYLRVQGARLGTVQSCFQPCTTNSAVHNWRQFYKHLESLRFSFESIFKVFSQVSAGRFTHLRDESFPVYDNPGPKLARSLIEDPTAMLDVAEDDGYYFSMDDDGRYMVHMAEDGIHMLDVAEDGTLVFGNSTFEENVVKSLVQFDEAFYSEYDGHDCVVTEECDVGLATISPGLVRANDEIWAIETCGSFVVLRPCGGRYRLFGGVMVCGPYTGSPTDIRDYKPFEVLDARGRSLDLLELVLE